MFYALRDGGRDSTIEYSFRHVQGTEDICSLVNTLHGSDICLSRRCISDVKMTLLSRSGIKGRKDDLK